MGEVVKFLGGTTAFLCIAGWLFRSLIKHMLDKDIQIYKEKLTHELRQKQYIFAKVYENRVEVLGTLHKKMIEASGIVEIYIKTMGTAMDIDKLKESAKIVSSFKDYYLQHKIWLDISTCKAIDNLLEEHAIFYKFANAIDLQNSGLGKDWVQSELMELWKRTDKQLPEVQKLLEDRFRELLGSDVN